MLFHGKADRLGGDRGVAGNRQTQRILHRVLALPGRQLQNLQVFAGGSPGAPILAQTVISHAKVACGKHVLPVLIVLEGTRFANQRIDHVAVVDGVLACTNQPRHSLDQHPAVPDLDEVGIDQHVDLVPDQSTGNGIGVPLDLNRTAAVDLDAADLRPVVQPGGWQLPEHFLFPFEPRRPCPIPLVQQLFEKALVLFASGEVPAASKQQGLFNVPLQVAMGRFHIAVLVGLASVDPLRIDPIVLGQVAVPGMELAIFREIVDRRAQAVAAMLARHPAQLPQGPLQTAAEGLEGLGKTNRNGFPIGIGEREVVEQVIERLPPDRDPQRVHVREVRCGQGAGSVDLGKDDFPVRPARSPPSPNSTFKRPPLGIRITSLVLLLKPPEEGKGTQLRLGLQPC